MSVFHDIKRFISKSTELKTMQGAVSPHGTFKYLCVQGEHAKDFVIGNVVSLKLTPNGEVGP